jgi:hypothetical protein
LKAAAQHLLIGRVSAEMIREEPEWIAVGLAKVLQVALDRLRLRHEPLPFALADDAKPKIRRVDGAEFQGRPSLMRKPEAYMRVKQAS